MKLIKAILRSVELVVSTVVNNEKEIQPIYVRVKSKQNQPLR